MIGIIAILLTVIIIMRDKIFKSDNSPSLGSDKPRGLRNNNPLNLRRTSIKWQGEKSEVTDTEFEEFESMAYGLRAGLVNIRTQINNGYDTIAKLIMRWAPPTENNTSNYVKIVSEKSGYGEHDIIEFQKEEMFGIVEAMVKVETGMNLTDELYEEAWSII